MMMDDEDEMKTRAVANLDDENYVVWMADDVCLWATSVVLW